MNRAIIVHISYQRVYQYKGWRFDYDRNKPFGPEPIKKDGTPRKRAGRVFYKAFNEFLSLPVEQQEEHRLV
ncbi:MAG: hypothetical protein RBS36_04360 [Thiomicrospira sp.]|jgi:hypothetical protein|nr:hypothetical protein [Thiomicrospira sp.]